MFNQGDTVFSSDGREARFIAELDGSFIVCPVYDSEDEEDGEPIHGTPEKWSRVYAKCPVERYDKEIAVLNAEISEKEQRLYALRSELANAEKATKDRLAKLQKFAALERLEDWIDGKFTHFVITPEYGTPIIATKEKALAGGGGGDPRYDTTIKLLTLFGDTKGDLQWKLNQYRDGSGSWGDVCPCASEEDAIATIRTMYAAAVAEWRHGGSGREHNRASYRAMGWPSTTIARYLDVPEDVAAAIRSRDIQAKQEAVAKARATLEQAEEALAAVAK